MKHADFVHLHVHSEYSLLDGAIRIGEAVALARAHRMPALAITDHGNLFGAVEFYHQSLAAGVKPLIGCEVYVAPGRRDDRRPGQGAASAASHLLLLARDRTGYQNLVRLVSIGYLEGFYYKPRIDRETLAAHADGLLGLSGCLKGEVPRLLLAGKKERAREAAAFYRDLFGPGHYYLEVMNHGIPEEEALVREMVPLAREMDLPLVATNDCHYLQQEHARAHDILLCLQTGKDLADPKRLRFVENTFHLRSPEEMAALFPELPAALHATVEVAQKCNVDLEPERLQLPEFPIPERFEDPADYLEAEAREGLMRRYGALQEEHVRRLTQELATIRKMGFATYFLIIRDLITAARARGIPVGPGRGSVAGSLVSYALGITEIDPLVHGLLFERFLNPERVTMPDIDIDFCYERRNEVIEYARARYGGDALAQIITFGTMAARAVIRDVGRVMGLPYGDVDRVAKMVPGELHITLERALERSPELKRLVEESPVYRELWEHARVLEGLSRHASTHAAGVVIVPGKLTDYVPLFQSTKGEVTTQYDMGSLEKLGLLKIDLLGLRTLTVIHDTVALLRERSGEELDPYAIPLEDPEVYRLLVEGNTVGVFQLESAGMRDLLRRLKPDRFEDVVAVNALYRPGPLGSDMVNDFIQGKRGQKKIHYLHPALEPILRPTYGVILYQEQVMAIAHQLAGFSLGRADILRKAMAKKKHEVMAEQRRDFVAGAMTHGVKEEKAEKIFDLMAHFAGYGFNKSHSAAYAMISVITAYLKAHTPREFMAATMTSEMGDTDRLLVLTEECRRMGIRVLPPDLNASQARFTVVEEGIRFGLAAVKNVGMASVEAALAARPEGPFTSLLDFTSRVDSRALNRRVVESLIQAGALDSLPGDRASLVASVPMALEYGQSVQRDRERGQESLFADAEATGGAWGGAEPRLVAAEPWSRREALAREKDALGFYLSGHPMEGYEGALRRYAPVALAELRERGEGESVTVAGMVMGQRRITSRKGQDMAFVSLEDRTGTTEVVVFAEPFQRYGSLLVEGSPLLVHGRLSSREEEEPKVIAREIRRLDDPDLQEEAAEVRGDASGTGADEADQGGGQADHSPGNPDVPGGETGEAGRSGLHLSIGPEDGENVLADLVGLLSRHRGDLPLFLHLATESAGEVDIASRNMTVRASPELLEELTRLLGRGRVRLT